jgi:2TM family of unknown function (DUF5676)
MEWLAENWFWVLVGILFVAVHVFSYVAMADRAARTSPLAIDINGGRNMLNTKLVSWALGIFAAITFVLCVIFGLVTPQSLHMHTFLEQVLPAFKWLTWWGFLLGLVESFLYGVYAGLVFCPIYNWLDRRVGAGRAAI